MRQEINGWRKHLDFIALDVICLHLAYALAYCLRFGWEILMRAANGAF